MTVKKSDLQAIKDYVAWRFNYTSDKEQRGLPEHWVDVEELKDLDEAKREEFKDDCDGHALAARYQCRKLGIPNRLVFCYVPREGYHLVLEVDGWIIDNASKWVISRDDIDYNWLSISGLEKGDPWYEITNG